MPTTCCVVLARGGSKRIPHKNIRLFNGLPIVAWPIKEALASKCFSTVYISTDSSHIEEIACSYGASSLELRPTKLANDFATTAEVLSYFLTTLYEKQKSIPEYLCCLYGTSVFISSRMIQDSLQKITTEKSDCVLAVTQYTHPVERALQFTENKNIQYLYPHNASKRTQDCQPTYYDIGLFYWVNTKNFMEQPTPGFQNLNKTAIIVPSRYAVDIDTEEDWLWAEQIAELNKTL